jgi:transcriptional regulatory protein RtcR
MDYRRSHGHCARGSDRRAGRILFDRSRNRKTSANDADRLRKYLARFDLEWSDLQERFRRF